jgi:L,D-peptidoglycan transpeptidase YkuD (ErfK/YbiS/YcfS/YnhG family)
MSARIPLFGSACALAMAMLVSGCAHRVPASDEAHQWQRAGQLVLVVTDDWDADHGTLRHYERARDGWREVGAAQPVMIGRAGAAWGVGLHAPRPAGPMKREGDGRSPAGAFAIGPAFGYATSAATALPYLPMQATDYCVDVSGSPLYNRIVDARVVGADAVAQSTEPMRRDLHADGDQRYRLGFVVEHNTQARPMAGSCIFAHLWKAPGVATSGCTAMPPAAMDAVLAWLRPDLHPVFVLLPVGEYRKLQPAWRLPRIDDTHASRYGASDQPEVSRR